MSTSYCFKMHIVFIARGQLFVAARLSREELRIIARPVIKDNRVSLLRCLLKCLFTILKRRSRSTRRCFFW